MLRDLPLQVGAAPTRHAVTFQVRPLFDQAFKCLFLRLRQAARPARADVVPQGLDTALIVAMHPVPS